MGHKMPKDKMYQDGKKKDKVDKLQERITKAVVEGKEKKARRLDKKQSKAAGLSQDKMYQDGNEKITKTMAQDKKGSGLYMDRDENGKLPKDRVMLHYDRMDQMREAKMAQDKKAKQMDTIDLSDKGYIGRDIAGSANELIRAGNKASEKLANNPIPRFDISSSGKVGRDIKSSANELVDAANKGLNYLFGK